MFLLIYILYISLISLVGLLLHLGALGLPRSMQGMLLASAICVLPPVTSSSLYDARSLTGPPIGSCRGVFMAWVYAFCHGCVLYVFIQLTLRFSFSYVHSWLCLGLFVKLDYFHCQDSLLVLVILLVDSRSIGYVSVTEDPKFGFWFCSPWVLPWRPLLLSRFDGYSGFPSNA